MHIDRFEAAFLRISLIMLGIFAVAILISVFGLGIQLPGLVEQVDPVEVSDTVGFDRPGLRELYPGKYEVHIVAQAWTFSPNEVTVPEGSEVTFFITSPDVIHGFKIMDTIVNIMVIPGQISEVSYTFDEAGTYEFVCHEYCGAGHHTMYGVVNVVEN